MILLASAGTTGCEASDVGKQCALVRKNPDGGMAITIREGELPTGAVADYVSLGSPDCEEACVRDRNAQQTGDTQAPALGYCSRACADEGQSSGCGQSFSCRALLLDTESLKGVCAAHPQQCEQFSGGTPSAHFCAKEGT